MAKAAAGAIPTPDPDFPDPGQPENEVPLLYDGPWWAEVAKVGRWRYRITFLHNAGDAGAPLLMGELRSASAFGSRTHADNKARRELNRRNRPVKSETWTIGEQP
jgi:hypothetical protein